MSNRQLRRPVAIVGAAVLVLVLAAGLYAVQSGLLEQPVAFLVAWAKASGARGMLALSALMPVWVALLLPGFILTMAAGVAWGPWIGGLVIHVPQVIGMVLAFLAGRYLFRDWVEARVANDSRFEAIDRAIEERGFVLVLLLRLSPIVPYNVLNYALGLTKVRLGPYFVASLIGSLPSTFLYTYLGASVGRVASRNEAGGSTATSVAWWVGLAATVVFTVVVGRIAGRAVRNAINVPPDSTADVGDDTNGLA